MNRTLTLALFGIAAMLAPTIAAADSDATSIATGGNPASMVVTGSAEPLAVLADGTVLAARATVGKGRVVALGHGGFLNDERGDTRAFLAAQLVWLAEDKRTSAWGVPEPLVRALAERGLSLRAAEGELGTLPFADVDLIVGSPQAFARAGRLDELGAWLREGGALLALETAWGQLQLGHAASVDDLAANRLLGGHGIYYTQRALSPGRDGLYVIDPAAARLANAEHALRVLAGDAEGDAALAARVVREALAVLPLDSELMRRADQLASRHAAALDDAYRSMGERPLRPDDAPMACALLDLEARRAAQGFARAHPSAAAFPGSVPADAPRLTRRITFDDGIPGWRTTGLYAAAGERIEARVMDGESGGMVVQIGCWLDPQQFEERVRMPVAVFRSPIENARGTVASPIGGPVYLDLPPAVAGAGAVTVEISGAVEMPRFRLGHTDLDEWRTRLRHLPAPWAELESDRLAFSLPADAIRDLDDPDVVMRHWDRVHEVMQSMEPRSPRHWPDRQYRYVAERRLSWGYMYCPSDAPIVIPLNEARAMVDPSAFDAEGPNRLWGHYHEMGHAHQNPAWTFAGTGEVTVNIFTVLALNTVNGYSLDDEAMRTEPDRALATMIEHRDRGAPFDRWKADPFLALQTYALLWHAFGWEAFRETFRSYDALAPDKRPRDDDAKRDEFAVRFGRTVGRHLGPYFAAWGVPLSERVERETGGLPVWMPDGL